MLFKCPRRWPWVLLIIVALSFVLWNWRSDLPVQNLLDKFDKQKWPLAGSSPNEQVVNSGSESNQPIPDPIHDPEPVEPDDKATHDIIYSQSTPDKKYFKIKMGDHAVFNPNVLAHPTENDTYIVIAQQDGRTVVDGRYWSEMWCSARFSVDGSNLECTIGPSTLFIAPTSSTKCEGPLSLLAMNMGPHDARVVLGPGGRAYIISGSQSEHACMGMWIQEFFPLIGKHEWGSDGARFEHATEIIRPPPWSPLEKNYFLFWDANETAYVHIDIFPHRTFARLEHDGSAETDLAKLDATSAEGDARCLHKLPAVAGEDDTFHQATNSLSITLCERADPSCRVNDANTVIFTFIHRKHSAPFHAVYDPYVIAFAGTAPFALYGISRKPFWIHGRRGEPGAEPDPQMFYVTSVSWKASGNNYHGYLDDVLLMNFGIENNEAAGIDVLAADLFEHIDKCT